MFGSPEQRGSTPSRRPDARLPGSLPTKGEPAVTIRVATRADAHALLAIYGPIVRDTAISFELEVPAEDEFARRIAEVLPERPWLVALESGEVIGYAYAGAFRSRPAYRWSVEVSVYVAEPARGQGVGGALYGALLRILRSQGYVSAYAGITLPNPGSVRLHERLGFRAVGVFHRAGFKLGAWRDVGWWECALATPSGELAGPRPFADLDRSRVEGLLQEDTPRPRDIA